MSSSIPSLRFHFLTPYYDFLFRLLLPAKNIRKTLLQIPVTTRPLNIVEIGCGTGSFTTKLAKKFPPSKIFAFDPDSKALSILTEKISKYHLYNIATQKASATQLQFNTASIDVMYSSLLFCNLNYIDKLKVISEAHRVLKNNSQFLIAEWGKPQTFIAKTGFTILQWVGGKENTEDIKNGMLPNYLLQAGFSVTESNKINTIFGTISFYQALKKN